MIKIAASMVVLGLFGCATQEDQNTSSLEQDVTQQTCTPVYDPSPPSHGGYIECRVVAYNGVTYLVHSSEADCTSCGVVLNHELCVENNYPDDLIYCHPHGPGGGGGGTPDVPGDPCSTFGTGCYQAASGHCMCPIHL